MNIKTSLLFAVIPGLLSSVAQAGTNDQAKIAVHLRAPVSKGSPCTALPPPPCNPGESNLNVQGSIGSAYHLYLLVLDGNPISGVAGASLGISYNDSLGRGLDVYSWSRCADLEFPGGPEGVNWPASGSGNVLTWDSSTHCQNRSASGDNNAGVSAILGVFYVYAYSNDVFSVTRREYVPSPDFAVSDCVSFQSNPAFPENAGQIGFGSEQGRDPCAEADTTAPGQIFIGQGSGAAGFRALSVSSETPLNLSWIAPADDGYVGKSADHYDLRYSYSPLSESNWSAASQVPNLQAPSEPGTAEHVSVSQFEPGTYYWIGAKAVDKAGNESAISNIVQGVTVDPTAAFWEQLHLGGMELWVAGTKADSIAELTFDGVHLIVNGTEIAKQEVSRPPDPSAMNALYGKIPSVTEAVDNGMSIEDAVTRWRNERNSLEHAAREAYETGGIQAARDALLRSPIVDKVDVVDNTVYVFIKGMLAPDQYALDQPQPQRKPKSRGLVAGQIRNSLKAHVLSSRGKHTLAFLTGAGHLLYASGPDMEAMTIQIRHIENGGSIETLPPGPLNADEPPLREIISVRNEGRGR